MNQYKVGSTVTVTTVRKSYVMGGPEYVESTYTGKVVRTPNWVEYGAVAIETGNPHHPVSIIAHKNIVGHVDIPIPQDGVLKVWTIDDKYFVESLDNEYSCTCKGFEFRRMCKHVTSIKERSDH